MQDADFFDLLYSMFVKTTCAEDAFWAVRDCNWNDDKHRYEVYAVQQNSDETHVAWFSSEVDADFIAALHGATPDLVRRLHNAIDESDRLDKQMDESQSDIAELARETLSLSEELSQRDEQIDRLEAELISARERIGQLEREAEEEDAFLCEVNSSLDHVLALQRDDRATAISAIAERDAANARVAQLEREAHECDIYVSGLQDHGRLQGWGD